ncbi:MAG: ABC transporter permease [Desulfonauticus sp.]|nr:ABC transporter permease [Desulfonauticus sp.]
MNKKDYLKSIFHFSLFFAKRDIKTRFAGSVLGVIWLIIQPVCLILIYFFVFSSVLKIKLSPEAGTGSFLVFLLIGLFPWLAFQEGCIRAATSIIDNAETVKKIPFPLESLPIGVIISSGCIHLCAFFIFLAGYIIYAIAIKHMFIPITISLLPIYILLQLIMTTGIGFFFASICTYLRDLVQVFNLAFQVWFYATPIVYPISMVPDKLKPIISINPLTGLIETYRTLILTGNIPIKPFQLMAVVFSFICFIIGLFVFSKLKQGFSDVL